MRCGLVVICLLSVVSLRQGAAGEKIEKALVSPPLFGGFGNQFSALVDATYYASVLDRTLVYPHIALLSEKDRDGNKKMTLTDPHELLSLSFPDNVRAIFAPEAEVDEEVVLFCRRKHNAPTSKGCKNSYMTSVGIKPLGRTWMEKEQDYVRNAHQIQSEFGEMNNIKVLAFDTFYQTVAWKNVEYPKEIYWEMADKEFLETYNVVVDPEYRKLRERVTLSEFVKQKASSFEEEEGVEMKNCLAVHVRRGFRENDAQDYCQKFMGDALTEERFLKCKQTIPFVIKRVAKELADHGMHCLFVAGDDVDVWVGEARALLGSAVKIMTSRNYGRIEAERIAIDLELCSRAKRFIATRWSSFSRFIIEERLLYGSDDDKESTIFW